MKTDLSKKRSFKEAFDILKKINPNVSKNGLRHALINGKIPHLRTAEGKYARIRVSVQDLINFAKKLEVNAA